MFCLVVEEVVLWFGLVLSGVALGIFYLILFSYISLFLILKKKKKHCDSEPRGKRTHSLPVEYNPVKFVLALKLEPKN